MERKITEYIIALFDNNHRAIEAVNTEDVNLCQYYSYQNCAAFNTMRPHGNHGPRHSS